VCRFQLGAFKTAVEAGVPVLPITLSGVRVAMPLKGFPSIGWFPIEMTIHKPISTEGLTIERPDDGSPSDIEKLAAQAREVIASALRPVDYYAGVSWEEDEAEFMKHWKGVESYEKANEAVGVDWKRELAKATERAGGRSPPGEKEKHD
jgi:hypothetical protein